MANETGAKSNGQAAGNGGLAGAQDDILQFATFYLNGELLGLNILQVQEIQQPQPVTPVPLSQPHILGLISLRGQVVPLLDLRTRLGMDTSEPIGEPYHVVVNTAHGNASFEVDKIGDVIDVPRNEPVPPAESVKVIDAKFLEGVYKLEDEILVVLNLTAVMEEVQLP